MSGTTVRAPAAPAGYAIGRERGATVVALPSVIEDVRSCIARAGTLYAAAASAGGQAFTGRGAAWRMPHAGGDWIVRHYRRGGAVAHVLRDEYLRTGAARPLRELRASVAARARGVATPEVLAGVVYPAGPFYRADLATRFIPDARDLAEVVLGERRAGPEERVAAWHAAGVLLRAAFDAGVEHADLNLRNILIAGGPAPRALLLDLDRAVVRERAVDEAARARMLERLRRSRRKLEAAAGRETDAAELAAFDAAVRGRDA